MENINRQKFKDRCPSEYLVDDQFSETAFCKQFKKYLPIIYVNGSFYTENGQQSKEEIRGYIYCQIQNIFLNNVHRKTDQLLQTLSLEVSEDTLPLVENEINVDNGSIWVSGSFHSEKRICPNRLPVSYNPEAPKPVTWLRFLDELFQPEDIPIFQEFAGYCLTSSTRAQKMLIIIGNGGEGKSRIGRVMKQLLKNNMVFCSLHKLEMNRFARADLVGKLLMIDDDLSISALSSTNIIKTIVTAEDPIDIEKKNKQSEQVRLYAKIMCFGNDYQGALYDHSNGFYRRQIILRTKPAPPDRVIDPYLSEKFEKEIEGIFLWCLEGLRRLAANNYKFTESVNSLANLAASKSSGNNFQAFFSSEGYIEIDSESSATTADLYRIYQIWCRDNAENVLSSNSFSRLVSQNAESLGIIPSNNIRNSDDRLVRGYKGIRVKFTTKESFPNNSFYKDPPTFKN